MKNNYLCLILAAMILILGGVGVAEETDFSSYSDEAIEALYEQIEALYEQIRMEMINRGIGNTAVFVRGIYKVGKEEYIPTGSYIIKTRATGNSSGIISVRTTEDPADDYPSKLFRYVEANRPYVGYLELKEGDVIESPVTFSLTIPAAVFK